MATNGPNDTANTDTTIRPRLMSLVREKLVHFTLPSIERKRGNQQNCSCVQITHTDY